MLGSVVIRPKRKAECEDSAARRGIADKVAAVFAGDTPRDGEPESIARGVRVQAEEAVEDAFPRGLRDARAVVGDAHGDVVVPVLSPSRRDFSSMAYDQAANTVVLFGGQTGSNGNVQATDLNDTWLLRI